MNLRERIEGLLNGEKPNYIFPFFWQHGEEESVLRHYMNVIHESNIGSVCVESRPHPDFLGDKWWADMDAILDEAQKLGMTVWILDDEHFPTGYAAGAVENAPKELCHQYLDYNTASVCGPMVNTELNVEKLAHPKPIPPWMTQGQPPKRVFGDDHLLAVVACPVVEKGNLGAPVDLTHLVKEGVLRWDVPEGYWRIVVAYLTRDAKGRNDYINMLDRDSCHLLIDTVYEPHYARYRDLFGTVIAGFFSDEPPIGNTPGYTGGDLIGKPDMPLIWSKAMAQAMEDEYGADWALNLPYLWAQGENEQNTVRIRVAYMNAVSKLVAENFSRQIGTWCAEKGVEYIGHMLEDCDSSANLGPSMGHFFRGLSGQHMAGIDNIGGQVLIGGQHTQRRPGGMCQDDAGFYHYMLGRMGASMAAIEPHKQGRCLCENFGAYGWQIGVRTEKYLTDHFLARGVNRYVPHAFTPKAFPDPDCPPHFYAHGENPQARAFGHLMAYTNRLCHLIDSGQCVAPIALLYHGESQWAGAYESNILACRELTRNQYGFVLIPADVFESPEEYRMTFDRERKMLCVNGIELGALVVSGCDYLPRAAARFACDAQDVGFPVVFTGHIPKGVSDANARESEALRDHLRGSCVTDVKGLAQTLGKIQPPDARLAAPFEDLTVYHYRNGGDVYLFLNEHPSKSFMGDVFVPKGTRPVGYDAWENCLYAIPFDEIGDEMRLTLALAPLEMAVVLIDDGLPMLEIAPSCEANERIHLTDFVVSYVEAQSYPAFEGTLPADLRKGMGIVLKDFSGFLRYETTVQFDKGACVMLSLTDAYESAEVFVNGKSAGMKTAQPYAYDITNCIRKGENQIAIEVATTLERKASAIGADVACMNVPAPLSPIGLVGEVTVEIYR